MLTQIPSCSQGEPEKKIDSGSIAEDRERGFKTQEVLYSNNNVVDLKPNIIDFLLFRLLSFTVNRGIIHASTPGIF